MDKKSNLEEKDDFWNISDMLPKKSPLQGQHHMPDTDTVTISVHSQVENPVNRYTIPPASTRAEEDEKEPLCTYTPPHPFIKKVCVWGWASRYTFYERFQSDARKYFTRIGKECDNVPFFSYMPQYNQLTYSQMSWYLWWRENIRKKIFLRTDSSYILLFVYEIINLPDCIPSAEGLDFLCDVWLAYRNEFPKLERYLCEWVCDYCLIHQLEMPYSRLSPILQDIVNVASLKEFYMTFSKGIAYDMLQYSTNYDWKKSRYLTKENQSLFEEHIPRAVTTVLEKTVFSEPNAAQKYRLAESTITRDSYSGALCAYTIKRRIDVVYYSYTRSHELRFLMTDFIKCAENHVRAACGIKARLSTVTLAEDMKQYMMEYFETYLPSKRKRKEIQAIPESQYDSLYDAPTHTVLPENANFIEESSWDTTHLLVNAFDEEITPPNPPTPPSPSPQKEERHEPQNEYQQFVQALSPLLHESLSAFLIGNKDGLEETAQKNHLLLDTIVEQINETAYECWGDIAITSTETGYTILSDYKEEILKWMKL